MTSVNLPMPSFFVISAQMMRAILLANATVTGLDGVCARILPSQGSTIRLRRRA